MKIFHAMFFSFLMTLFSITAISDEKPYQGQELREIKSLSTSDIEAITQGSGWGLAKPAELNGIPGPAHVLELQQALNLSEDQVKQVQTIWKEMHTEAKKYGLFYLSSERSIDIFFQKRTQDEEELDRLLNNSAVHLAKLRKVHLVAYLKVKPLLTEHQIMQYNNLRGYSKGSYHHYRKHH